MLKRSGSWMVLLCGVLLTFGCASTEDVEEAQRREQVQEEDNVALRAQLEDLKSTEAALSRELELKGQEVRRLNAETATLKGQLTKMAVAQSKPSEKIASTSSTRAGLVSAASFRQKGVETISNSDGSVTIRLSAGSMFGAGRAELTKGGRGILDTIAGRLKSRKELQISVEGHTDATPLKKTKAVWGTNLGLSLARAMSVQDYLKQKKGIAEDRMRVVGYGEHRPIARGKTNSALARNRRVEIVLTTR